MASSTHSRAFLESVHRTLEFEGGWSDRGPDADRGGRTMFGITEALAHRYGLDVQTLTKDQALHIYHEEFWSPLHLDEFPHELSQHMFDFAVTSGPGRSVRCLQRAYNVLFTPPSQPLKEDGMLGVFTLESVLARLPKYLAALVGAFRGERYRFYRSIWESDPAYASQNIRGWSKRI